MELKNLKIVLKKIHKNSYLELERTFSKFEGVTCPGLDVSTRKFELVYDPKTISKEKIPSTVKNLGYVIEKVID